MIEAAAQMYCQPEVNYTMQTFQAEGRSVLVVQIEESLQNPYMPRMKQENRWLICASRDENILPHRFICVYGSKVVVRGGELITYTEREQLLLDLLEENDSLSLNRYCRLARLSPTRSGTFLAKFIRFDIVEPVFEGHKFHFRLK